MKQRQESASTYLGNHLDSAVPTLRLEKANKSRVANANTDVVHAVDKNVLDALFLKTEEEGCEQKPHKRSSRMSYLQLVQDASPQDCLVNAPVAVGREGHAMVGFHGDFAVFCQEG